MTTIDIFQGLPAYPVGALSSLSLRLDRVEQLLQKYNLTKVLAVTMLEIRFVNAVHLTSVFTSLVFFRNPWMLVFFLSSGNPANICPIQQGGISNISSEFPSNFTRANIVQNSGNNCWRKHSGTHISCGVCENQHGFVPGRSCETNLATNAG